MVRQGPGTTGLSPSPAPLSRGLGPGPPLRTVLQTTIWTPRATDSQAGLFPVRSPLLRESLDTGSRVTGTGRGRGVMKRPHPLPLMFDNTFTGRSARQVQWTSRDVAGSEPPTSPRSEHFTGPFNRQIAPPTKNGHAPPPIESRKSSQSVNPYYVWTCAGGTTRPIKARSASPAVGTSRPVLTVRRTGRPTPRSNYELFNCNNLNIRYWSWNYRGCWQQTCPPMDPR
ncbi:hypothetical protein V6N13_030545 [Hibiscus sabdariffa]